MKKTLLLSLVLSCSLLLVACGEKPEETSQNNNEVAVVNTDCVDAVQEYLKGADVQGQGDKIQAGDNIVVDYIGRLEDGTVFDTSIKSIAEICGKYNEARDYTQGLSFEVGAGQMIKGFDDGVIGMKLGQTKTVKFGPELGYGEYDNSLIIKAPIAEVGDTSQLNEGDTVYLGMGYPAKVLEITGKEVTFDMNNELAGKNLIFDITIKSIN